MTKLSAKEIKGIIEERGSNILEVIIDVSQKIFSYPEVQQNSIISNAVFGYSLKSPLVKSIVFNGVSNQLGCLTVKAVLNFSEEVLTELKSIEEDSKKATADAFILNKTLRLKEAFEVAEQKVTSFNVGIPTFIYSKNDNIIIANYISDMIVEDITFENLTILPSTSQVDPSVKNSLVRVIVKIDDFAEQLEHASKSIKSDLEAYESITEYGVRLIAPLDGDDIYNILQEEIQEFEENEEEEFQEQTAYHYFNYFVEVDYDQIVENDFDGMSELISNLILDEMVEDVEFEELNHKVVGFNPATNKVIIHAEGGLAISV